MTEAIKVTYRGALYNLTGRKEDTIPTENIRGVLEYIKKTYGAATHKTAKTMLITVNGKSILRLKLFKTQLKGGDTVSFLPICAGG
jgi:molybdopterin converting factor small subunit